MPAKASCFNAEDVAGLFCNNISFVRAIQEQLIRLGIPVYRVEIIRNFEFGFKAHAAIKVVVCLLRMAGNEPLNVELDFCFPPITTLDSARDAVFQIPDALKAKYDTLLKNQ